MFFNILRVKCSVKFIVYLLFNHFYYICIAIIIIFFKLMSIKFDTLYECFYTLNLKNNRIPKMLIYKYDWFLLSTLN